MYANFQQAPEEEASLSNPYVRGTLSFCVKWSGHRDALTRKKAGFPCSGLKTGSSFISQDEGMSESPVETLGKALDILLIWAQASHPSDPSEVCRVQCFKR